MKLTEDVKAICETLVAVHIPREMDVFDAVWTAFWHALGVNTIEKLPVPIIWRTEDNAITDLGAIGDQESQTLDSLYVIGALSTAAADCIHINLDDKLTTRDVLDAIRNRAQEVGAPKHVRELLEKHAVDLLADQLSATDWEEPAGQRESFHENDTWVEWFNPSDIPSGPSEIPTTVQRKYCPICELTNRFPPEKFTLWVNELIPSIWVHPPRRIRRRPKEVIWSDLGPRHEILLGLVLRAFERKSNQKGSVLTYETVAKLALGYDGEFDNRVVTDVKGELDRCLSKVLGEAIKNDRKKRLYSIDAVIPYCWIRDEPSESRLFPSADKRFSKYLR